jgi:hypothetical protein
MFVASGFWLLAFGVDEVPGGFPVLASRDNDIRNFVKITVL